MIKLFTELEYKNSKDKDLLPLQCVNCSKTFLKKKEYIRNAMNPNRRDRCNSCSIACARIQKTKKITVSCNQCGVFVKRDASKIKRSKFSYCSKSCRSKYSITHKTTGSNRSKLEKWIEQQLTKLYPNLLIEYNNRSAIKAELDIYIPSLKLAFEINGIFHFEPIFGKEALGKVQTNDKRKFQACIEQGISLCVIDSASLKYFKPDKAKKYLDIITNIINESYLVSN